MNRLRTILNIILVTVLLLVINISAWATHFVVGVLLGLFELALVIGFMMPPEVRDEE